MLLFRLLAILVALIDRSPFQRAPRVLPPAPATAFTVATDNIPQAKIAGVVMPANGRAKGTVFLLHGFSRSKEDLFGWNWIRRDLGWNLVAFDFREHGQSSHNQIFTSLGYHEIWDVKAVVDEAERRGLAKPYVIYGNSMGASAGVRWAERDPQISGVLAVSPFRNALAAARGVAQSNTSWWTKPLYWDNAATRMLDAVDLPTDVKQRSDLRLWILCGEHDIFTAADQHAILNASPSPQRMKKLFIIPGGGHNNLWRWRGDDKVPSHQQIIRDFLHESE